MDYFEKLKDPRWQRKRLEIFERDGWECRWCSNANETLHIHHLFYFQGKEPWEAPDGSLISLCESCHSSVKKDLDSPLVLISEFLETIWKCGYGLYDLSNISDAIRLAGKRPIGTIADWAARFETQTFMGDSTRNRE